MDDWHIPINLALAASIWATFLGWLPPIAALIAVIWYSIQIYESKTAARFRAWWKARRIVRLRARLNRLSPHE